MSVQIMKPAFTNAHVRKVFVHLVTCEVFKATHGIEMEEGKQDGYMLCLEDLFGESGDESVDRAYEEQKDWIHIVERIATEKLSGFEFDSDCPDECMKKIEAAVEEYLLDHMDEAYAALQVI